jgi:hypothetical protein
VIKSSKIIGSDIFVYGKALSFMTNDFYAFIAKFSIDGIVDTSFGTNGIVSFNTGTKFANDPYSDGITDVVYKDGHYFAIGTVLTTNNTMVNVFAVKLDVNGTPDLAFDPSGLKKFTSVPGHAAQSIVEYQDDLLIMGNISNNNVTSEHSATFLKIDENGNPVTAYGSNGLKKIVLINGLCSCGSAFRDCTLTGDILYYKRTYGSISGGYTKIQKLDISTLVDVNPVADVSITDIAYISGTNYGNYYLEGNKIYILDCPVTDSSQLCDQSFIISRRFTDGTLDTSFNQTGVYSFDFPAPFVGATTYDRSSVLVKTADRILIGGYTSSPGYTTAPYAGFAMLKIGDEVLANENFNLKNSIAVYPNPSKGIVNIDSKYKINAIEINNILGQKISAFTPNELKFSVHLEIAGIYMVQIQTEAGVQVFKVIID